MAQDIKAIDVMNYLFTPERARRTMAEEDYKRLFSTTRPPDQMAKGFTVEEFVAQMDEAGYEKTLIPALRMYSYRNRKLISNDPIEEVYEVAKKSNGRLVGLAGYNPLRIMESLREVEKGVKEYGFKGVYCHLLGFDIRPDDPRMYPLYAKCAELGVPVSMQVGHSAEAMPSECGRPMYLDKVALDFPEVVLIGSHTGWPWREEMIAMAGKHQNVYADCSAWLPATLDPSFVRFMDGWGRDKTLFGTNSFGFKRCKEQFLQLPLKDENKVKILRDNAIKVFKL